MKKTSVVMVIFLVVLIQGISICIISENASAQETQYVKLYQHVETELDVNSAWLDTIRAHPDSANRIKIAENAINIDWEITYLLTPALQSTLYVQRETKYYIHQFLQSDTTANNVEVHVHFESEDGSQHWAHKTDTKDVTSTGTSFSSDFTMGNLDDISPNENIQLRINVVYTGLPRTLYLLNENDHPSGINIPVKNPLNIDISAPVDEENEKVTVSIMGTSPFGEYHIDKSSYSLTWNGPTTPTTVSKTGESVWEWNYGADNADPGDYKVSITASDIVRNPDTPNSVSSETSFTIPKSSTGDLDSDDHGKESFFGSPFFLGGIGLVIIITIIIIVIILWRRRNLE